MEAIPGVTNINQTNGTQTAAGNEELGQSDFLQLLIAQLQAQDPLNPLDGADFTAQLAQFNSLEQLTDINESLNQIYESQISMEYSRALEMIGRTIKVSGNQFKMTDGKPDAIQYSLEGTAKSVYAAVYDNLGRFVTTIESGFQEAGDRSISWDGKNLAGNTMPDGLYSYEVSAVDFNGLMVGVKPFRSAVVSGVSFENGAPVLMAKDQTYSLDSVLEVTSGSGETGLPGSSGTTLLYSDIDF